MVKMKKKVKIPNVEDADKLDYSYIAGGYVKWYSLSGKQCNSFLNKSKDATTI